MKKLLITGATGFVGQQVLHALSEKNVELRLVVRQGKENEVGHLKCAYEIVNTKDLFAENTDWWIRKCEGIDTVLHLAWYAEPGKYLESPKNLDCLVGSINLAKGAIHAGVRRFIGTGTCFEYDLSTKILSTDTPLNPKTPYAGAKVALYLSLFHLLPMQCTEFAWCRLFYLYGKGEDSRRLVPYLHARLKKGEPAELTSGKQIRDFLDVTEAAQMIARVTLGKQTGPVNICSGSPITVRQLAEKIADIYGRRDLLKFGARGDSPFEPKSVIGKPSL